MNPRLRAKQLPDADVLTEAEAAVSYAPIAHSAGATGPSDPAAGWVWYDSGNDRLKYYTGSAWSNVQATTADVGISTLSQSGNILIASGDVRIAGADLGFGADFSTKISYNSVDERLEFYVDGTINSNLAMYVTNEGTIYVDNNPLATGTDLYGGVFDTYNDPKEIKDFIHTSQKIKDFNKKEVLPDKEYAKRMKRFKNMGLVDSDNQMHLQNYLRLVGGGVYQLADRMDSFMERLDILEKKYNHIHV